MKKFKSLIWVVSVYLVFCVACSPKANTEKEILEIHKTMPQFTKEMFYEMPDNIAKVYVKRVIDEYFTDADDTRLTPSGEPVTNIHVTRYELEIKKIYKGALDSNTIELKTYNGEGLTPDLYLYGEDETQVLSEPLDILELQVGKEYIISLEYYPEEAAQYYGDTGGYGIQYGKAFCFTQTETGLYENMLNGLSHISIDPETLESEIQQHLENAEK